MPLRVMQIFLPKDAENAASNILEGKDILGEWHDRRSDKTVLHLLVPADETEPIMDELEQSLTGVKDFSVLLLPVEAALPRPASEDEPNQSPEMEELQLVNETDRISREELYSKVNDSIGISRVFVGMALLSAVVAAVGLMRNDVAVIIGAMVIAPLLGPNVAMALATTLGDTNLLRRALFANVVGIGSAFLLSIVIGAIFGVDPDVPAIRSRTVAGIGDILLALAAGSAGTLAFTRGLSDAVIGVMVAVALVPPLVVSGILYGAGQTYEATGALMLTGANVICINLAGIVTFLVQGVMPRRKTDADRARFGTLKATVTWTILLGLLLLFLWLNQPESRL